MVALESTFEELEAEGYISEYVRRCQDGQWHPDIDLLTCCEMFAGKGEKVRYLGQNGYDIQRETFEKRCQDLSAPLEVLTVSIGSSMSYYTFKDVEGSHNTVMFERIQDDQR